MNNLKTIFYTLVPPFCSYVFFLFWQVYANRLITSNLIHILVPSFSMVILFRFIDTEVLLHEIRLPIAIFYLWNL